MIDQLQLVAFREFLKPNSRPYTLGADEDANLIGMRLYGAGPFHRELKAALRISKKSHFVIRAGDVIYNKLFAWKGAFGIVPYEFDGMFVSDKFPTYVLDQTKVDANYLKWFFRFPDIWEQARKMSTGSAALSKLTLNPPKFLDLKIPVPLNIARQKAISQKLDRVADLVKEAVNLRDESAEMAQSLQHSARSAILESCDASGKLSDVLLQPPRNGWSPRCDNMAGGISVLTLSAVTGWKYDASATKLTSVPTSSYGHYWLNKGDLLITRSNTPDLVGHAAIYSGDPSPCIYPDLMMRLTVDQSRASTPFVWHWLQSEAARDYVKRNAKGTSPTMKKISQGIVADIPFPVGLSLTEQNNIVCRLSNTDAQSGNLLTLHSKTRMQLDAILPSVLSRAFNGEL